MALDGIFLHSLLDNLKPNLINLKIDKINQPEKDEIILTFRQNRKNIKLLLSASSNYPRIHFTEMIKENPLKAPMFLMVLRKYLLGGRIVGITQKDGDRIVIFNIESSDELGFNSSYSLIVEIMGRHSNITLIRMRDNKIMDSIKHITPDINSYRVLYPGASYVFAPSSIKLNPFDFTSNDLDNYCSEFNIEYNELFYFNILTGVSKPLSKELFIRYSKLDNTNLFDFIKNFVNSLVSDCSFTIYLDKNGLYKDFYCILLSSYSSKIKPLSYDSPSEMLDHFYSMKDKQERLLSRSTDMQKLIHVNIERCNKKGKILQANIVEGLKKDDAKMRGDLLTSYIYNIKPGDEFIEVINFFSENSETIKIILDKNKTPSENIQKYYKRYSKLKKSEEWAITQLKKNTEELNYLNSVLTNVLNVESYEDIEQIKTELRETGYIKFKNIKNSKNNKKQSEGKPYHFVSSTGMDIYVGKNNLQNDYLSLKFAHRNDLWLHTKEIPGSHVIIKGENIDDTTLNEAAILAAYYSKGKSSSNVPVDYTMVRNLKKPNGAKPGMVIYNTNKTLYINPGDYEELNIKKL